VGDRDYEAIDRVIKEAEHYSGEDERAIEEIEKQIQDGREVIERKACMRATKKDQHTEL